MARAMARGWDEPVLVSDSGSGRAETLAAELGGRAASNLEVAREADLVVLCHKPYQLQDISAQLAGTARAVASVLGATTVAQLQDAYPDTPVFRLMPNTPVEVRRGIVCYAPAPGIDATLEGEVIALFERLGWVATMPESLMDAATGISGVGPAYLALIAEAQADAAIRWGLKPDLAGRLIAETMAGSAALLDARGYDTLAMRREVTSPGGSTARGLDALERSGIRSAFSDAINRVNRGIDPS